LKTNIIEKLDELQKQKRLSKESKEKIKNLFALNLIISISILIYFITVQIATITLDKNLIQDIYQLFAFVTLGFVFILFEIAYKKSSQTYFGYGIEFLSIAIVSLFVPYIYIKREPTIVIKLFGIFYTIYYLIKSIIMAEHEKNLYAKAKNDISEIIKKESQDEMSIAYFAEIEKKKEKQSKRTTQKETAKKRGRPRKNAKRSKK